MKREGIICVLVLVIIFGLLPGAARTEDARKFRFLEGIDVGAQVTDLAVTPDDRYVLAVASSSQTMKVVDTWDFSLVEGATINVGEGEASPMCIAVSPYGGYAYAGLDSGDVAIIDLAALYELLPYEELEEAPAVSYMKVEQGLPVNRIAAIPDVNLSNDDVYLLMGTVQWLYWVRLTGGGEPGQPTSWSNSHEVVALDAATTRGFELFYDGGNYKLQTITCSGSCGPLQTDSFKPASGDTLQEIAAKPGNANFSITANISESKLMLIDTWPADSMQVGDSLEDSSFSSVTDLELLGGTTLVDSTVRRSQAVTIHGGTGVTVTELEDDNTFSGNTLKLQSTEEEGATVIFSSIAASSPADGYVYAGSEAGYVYPLTMNPEVVGLTATPPLPVTASKGTTVKFQLDMEVLGLIDYNVYESLTFNDWGNSITSGTIEKVEKGDSVTFGLKSDDLEECGNVITVIADKDGNKGRDAITIYKDTKPPKPSFSLGFGDRKIYVKFTASFLCDLDRYEIFYGSASGGTVLDSYTALESNYDKKTIPEPLAGEDIEKVIKSLTNGVRYYVYLVVFDESENYAISDRKSTVPDKVATFTELAGEDGGVDCLGSVAGGRALGPAKLAGLVAPLLVAGLLLFAVRRRS